MSTKDNKINELSPDSGKGLRIGIVKAKWNSEITDALLAGAIDTLKKYGAEYVKIDVPGSIELTYGAKKMIQRGCFDAVVVLGCVIQGETRHFDFVCQSVTQGITELNILHDIPVIFGVLTTNNMQQAIDRAGGKLGNKGSECAIAAIEMANLEIKIQ
jgi:6,7-dimethyl-8-ribityllumazine synthase